MDAQDAVKQLKRDHDQAVRELAEVRAKLARLVNAFDVCDGNRGRFSCVHQHDLRCEATWTRPRACSCGSDELEAALAAAREGR